MATTIKHKYHYQYRWMIAVTQNPNHPHYHRYGGQGITCDWSKGQYYLFEEFIDSQLGPRPTPYYILGRKDKSKGWSKKNLEWQLPITRSNRKNKQNCQIKFRNKTQTISEWSRELNIAYWLIRKRLSQGKSMREIVKELA